jgi:hypothetical protein
VAWTRPKTWSSEPLTSLDLNTYMRDNQTYLKDRLDNSISRVISADSNFTTSSSTWVDVDSAALALTLDTLGGAVFVGYAGNVRVNRDNYRCYFNLAVDGADHFAGDGFTQYHSGSQDNDRLKPLCFVLLIPDLAAGRHSFVLRWKTQSGSVSRMDVTRLYPQFWAKEI